MICSPTRREDSTACIAERRSQDAVVCTDRYNRLFNFNDHLPCCRNTAVLIAALSLCFADKTHTVELCANDTVQDVKAVIEARQGKIN